MTSPKPIDLHPDATQEIRDAHKWYASRSKTAAKQFAVRLHEAFQDIQQAPHAWPVYDNEIRHFLLRQFPYHLFYEEFEHSILVYAVAHSSRMPDYWRRRTT